MNIETNDLMSLLDQAVRMTVHQTVLELRKGGFLKANDSLAYQSAAKSIKQYYDAIKAGEPGDPQTAEAINALSNEDYHGILKLYYCDGYTVEELSEMYGCGICTITRNKKRLCIEVWNRLN